MIRQSNLINPIDSTSIDFLQNLEKTLRLSFDLDTCYPDDRKYWTKEVPAYGQCAITSLVVQDYLGGDIVFDQENNHFWNRIDGVDLDFTREQFEERITLRETKIRSRQEILEGPRAETAKTSQRYQILKNRVKKLISRDKVHLEQMFSF